MLIIFWFKEIVLIFQCSLSQCQDDQDKHYAYYP